ncbi:MAG: hypothetical protein K2Q09_05810 [Phycisphaerales bacterium]|nr:hypothetical protein [Phycisphaerales bacterium]
MSALAVAGILKLVDLGEFHRSISGWSTLPAWASAGAALTVPVLEVLLPALWICGVQRRSAAVGAAVMLIVFTAALVIEGRYGVATGCSCWGSIPERLGFHNTIGAGIIRNVVLLALLVPGLAEHRGPHRRALKSAGFTLVETLVTLSMVGLLVGLSLWGLSAVRTHGRFAAAVARVADHGRTLSAYCADYRDTFPFFTTPGAVTTLSCADRNRPINVRFFQAFRSWSVALGDGYYAGHSSGTLFRSPFNLDADDGMSLTDYFYPCTFVAAPEYWNRETRLYPPLQLVGTRGAQVRFPDRKALIVHDPPRSPSLASALAASFVDGHAERIGPDRASRDRLGDGLAPWIFPYGAPHETIDLMHTEGGVYGADVRR